MIEESLAGSAGCGSGRQHVRRLPRLPAYPYREYSEVFFGERLPRAARRLLGDATRASRPPPSATGICHSAGRSSPACASRRRRTSRPRTARGDHEPIASGSTPGSTAAEERSLADDVLDGLTRPFKELPPKHFYDARGAELFDQICELPEYYPTRTERAILEQTAPGRSSRADRRRSSSSSSAPARPTRRACCSTR